MEQSVYLVNHTLRETHLVGNVSDIFNIYENVLFGSYHNDPHDWKREHFIEPASELELTKFRKCWEDDDTKSIAEYFYERHNPQWCCHADGYFETCCKERYFIDKFADEICHLEDYIGKHPDAEIPRKL